MLHVQYLWQLATQCHLTPRSNKHICMQSEAVITQYDDAKYETLKLSNQRKNS